MKTKVKGVIIQRICFTKMHELAITQNILDIALSVAKTANARKVNKINLVIGKLSGVVSDCIQFYFDFLKKGTIAEDATLAFEIIPAQLKCRQCFAIFNPEGLSWTCPECYNQQVEIVAGCELYVDSLEID